MSKLSASFFSSLDGVVAVSVLRPTGGAVVLGSSPTAMTDTLDSYQLQPIGVVRSPLKARNTAPNQGSEGAPDAWIELAPSVHAGLDRVEAGDELIVITWLHESRRDVLKTHPRGDASAPLTGVFATRSPDRPNPLGLHPVTVLEIGRRGLKVGPLEAIDGTPVVDIKPVLRASPDW